MDFEMNTITTFIGIFGYMCIFVLFINILDLIFNKQPAQIVEHTHCTEGKCKNESFKESRFCYWHDPVRKIVYPVGSEMTPRRSQRIAAQRGVYYTCIPE
jgi:hypothetical protein